MATACKLARFLYEPLPPREWYPRNAALRARVLGSSRSIVKAATPPRHLHLNSDGLDGVVRDATVFALKESAGFIRGAARILKCHPSTVTNNVKRHHLEHLTDRIRS